jgi:phosphatidate phosphatase APP1
MVSWQHVLTHLANDVEEHFDALKYRLRQRLDTLGPLMIASYRGCGTADTLYLRGRVLEDTGIVPARDNDTVWANLVNMYRRFDSHEAPGARVLARFDGVEQEVVADEEGFFEVWLHPTRPLPAGGPWYQIELELVSPLREGQGPVRALGDVFVPPPAARFAVISDVDDTVVQTNAASLLRMARTVFLGNARTRLPFEGVAAFYRALYAGASGREMNPLFYVSSSPWNLYDLLYDFFDLQNIPAGPFFLRDWGLTEDEILPIHNRDYKLATIHKILTLFPHLPFILIGDSGQEDPEIYQSVVNAYPHRVLAAYIRNVSRDPTRPEAIRALATKIVEAGSTLILAQDTEPLARHAAEQGWISPATLEVIRAARRAETAPPTPVETLLGVEPKEQKPPGPTVVVEGQNAADGSVEQALQAGDKSQQTPTVVVKGK